MATTATRLTSVSRTRPARLRQLVARAALRLPQRASRPKPVRFSKEAWNAWSERQTG